MSEEQNIREAGECTKCGGKVYHRQGKPGEFDHDCTANPEGWVSVEDRLPEKMSIELLGAWHNGAEMVASHVIYTKITKRWLWVGDGKPVEVTHWRPLPPAPERVEGGK